jgi:hypothetical protein
MAMRGPAVAQVTELAREPEAEQAPEVRGPEVRRPLAVVRPLEVVRGVEAAWASQPAPVVARRLGAVEPRPGRRPRTAS